MNTIAHIVNLAGPNHWLNGVATHADRSRFRHIAINLGRRSGLHDELATRGVDGFALDASDRKDYPRALLRLIQLLRRQKVDLIQTHTFDPTSLGLAASVVLRETRTLLTRHHADFTTLFDKPIHRQIDRLHAMSANHVWSPSRFISSCMQRYERVDPRKITILPHAFDFEMMRPRLTRERRRQLREEAGGDERFLVGMVARLAVEKSHETLLQAASLVQRVDRRLSFVVIGDGPRRAELEQMSSQMGLSDRVRFLGWRWDAWDLIEAMDVIAHPSLREPFGIVYVEGMALERAIVTTTDGAAPEILDDGDTGLLIAPRDPRALAEGLLSLSADPSRVEAMGALARKRAIERYAFPRLMPDYESYYTRILA